MRVERVDIILMEVTLDHKFNISDFAIRPSCDKRPLITWLFMICLVCLCWLLAWLFYPDPFTFDMPISAFSHYVTHEGSPNPISMYLFSMSMGIFALGWGLMTYWYNSIPHQRYMTILTAVAMVGSFLSAFPDDINHDIHVVGTALWAFSVLFILTVWIIECYSIFSVKIFYLTLSVLWISALVYTILFFGEFEPEDQIAQKIAFFVSLAIGIWIPIVKETKGCDQDEFMWETVSSALSCRVVGGIWEDDMCRPRS